MYRIDKRSGLLLLACFAILVATPNKAFTQAGDSATAQNPSSNAATASQQTPQVAVPNPQATPEQLGDLMMARKRYEAAIKTYSQISPRSATVWNKLGIAYQMMFNHEEAEHCYRKALKLDPHNAKVMNNLGTIYDSERRYHDAQKMYHKALKYEPKSALIRKNLGTALMAEHKYKEGWKMYESALAIDPQVFDHNAALKVDNPTSVEDRGAMNYYMARGCARVGLTERALYYLRKALIEGYATPKKIAQDGDFARLRGNPEFEQLIAAEKGQ